MIGTLLLDLDGTLVDSVPDLAASLNRLMAARGLARFSDAETAAMVGDGARKLVERAFAARGLVADEAAMERFMADYAAHLATATRPYPGVETTLRTMTEAGWRLAVCTNKPEAMARALLTALGLADLFRAIGGGDSFSARKPDPAHILATLRRRRRHARARGDGRRPCQRCAGRERRRPALHLRRLGLRSAGDGARCRGDCRAVRRSPADRHAPALPLAFDLVGHLANA